jgi:CelD/BcsL family acetyltransferase involved in cellulose biosynthesis
VRVDAGPEMTLVTETANTAVGRIKQATRTVCEIDPLGDPRWAVFVRTNPQSSVFHSTQWLSTLRSAYGYEPVVLTTSTPGTPLTNGVVLCKIKSWLTGSRVVSLPFSDHCEPLVNSAEELDILLAHMRRYVDLGEWKYAEVRPLSLEPRASTQFSRHLTYCFHSVNLNRGTEDIFRSFHKDCVQRKIRRAEREKLRYEDGNSDTLLRRFYRLMVATRRRQALPPQPIAWFQGLAAQFGSDLKIRVASYGDLPVASILTLSHKKSMTYKYGCSDAAFNKLGGMSLLFWKAIQEAKEQGCEEFDLGRSDSDNLGLIAFKDHWGAVSSSLTYWTYPQMMPARSWTHNRLVRRVTSSAPALILETVGRILYRHIG